MTIQHSAIADPNIHEPKGVSTAAAGTIYIANGSGSGSWKPDGGSSYGDLYITSGATSQTLSAASAYAILNPASTWASGVSNGVTLTPASGYIVLSTAGTYLISFWANFTTAALSAGTAYNFKYAINGTTSTRKLTVTKISNGADNLHVSASGIMTVSANDQLSMYVGGDGTSSSTAITVTEAGLTAVLLKAS